MRDEYKTRTPVLGVEPELVFVLECNRQLSLDDVVRAGLTILELRSESALVAFASDPELSEFNDRLERYQAGSPGVTEKGNERSAAYQSLFDAIDCVRSVEPRDVIGPGLAALLESTEDQVELRIDIECWCGEDAAEATRRNSDVQLAVVAAGGRVLDHGVRPSAGWSTVCAVVPAGQIGLLAGLDRVRRIDGAPQPSVSYPSLRATTAVDLPLVTAPEATAPILAMVDSGVRSAHPLLAPAVIGVEYVGPGLADGGDETGHGTMVASLALYGALEDVLLASRLRSLPGDC